MVGRIHIHLIIRTEEFPYEGSIRFKAEITVSNLKYRTTLASCYLRVIKLQLGSG